MLAYSKGQIKAMWCNLKQSNLKLIYKLCLLGVFCSVSFAHADSICQVKGGGILDGIVTQFGNAMHSWQAQINIIAKKIFFILFGTEFMWQLTVKKVFAGDIEKLWVFFFTRTVLCFFFAKYLVNFELYQDVIVYITHLGSSIGGFMLNINPGQNFTTLGPSEIMGHFACVADSIHTITDNTGALQYITLKITLAIVQVMLFFVLSAIAYYVMKVILQAYFLLYIGFILTGFAGSSWTATYWQRYVQAIAGIAIKFLAVCVIMGVMTTEMKDWANSISIATTIPELGSVVLKVFGVAIIFYFIASELPEWAASALAGNFNMRFGEGMSNISNFMSGGGVLQASGSKVVSNPTLAATAQGSHGGGNLVANHSVNPMGGIGQPAKSTVNRPTHDNVFQTAAKSELEFEISKK